MMACSWPVSARVPPAPTTASPALPPCLLAVSHSAAGVLMQHGSEAAWLTMASLFTLAASLGLPAATPRLSPTLPTLPNITPASACTWVELIDCFGGLLAVQAGLRTT